MSINPAAIISRYSGSSTVKPGTARVATTAMKITSRAGNFSRTEAQAPKAAIATVSTVAAPEVTTEFTSACENCGQTEAT